MRKRNGLFLVSLSLPLVSKPYLHYYFWADLFCVGASYDEDRISLPVEDLWLRKQEYVRYKGGWEWFYIQEQQNLWILSFLQTHAAKHDPQQHAVQEEEEEEAETEEEEAETETKVEEEEEEAVDQPGPPEEGPVSSYPQDTRCVCVFLYIPPYLSKKN